MLRQIFHEINEQNEQNYGLVDIEKFRLIREHVNYNYVLFLNLCGEDKEGYGKMMFHQNCERP